MASLAAAVCVGAAGCMPAAGPSPQAVFATGKNTDTSPYLLVKASPNVVKALGDRGVPGFSGIQDRAPSPRITLGVGDVVTVTIFESSAGGLFIPNQSGSRPGNFVQLPDQNVDNAGNITVPYAGAIKAAGQSIPSIQDEIVERLRDRALEPQVVITLKDQKSTQVSVLGEVNGAGRFPINPAGDRLLDAIARAGGPKHPNYEVNVSLQRQGREATISMAELVRDPGNNLYVRGGDIIVLSREARTYVVFGAAGEEGRFEFTSEEMTVSDALGRARGILDLRASPSDIFVYRLEDKALLTSAGYDTGRFPGELVPTVYAINLRDPNGYFLTSNFDLQDKDVLYIANSPVANFAKVLAIVRSGGETVTSVKEPF
jgi:polysaccharide export outer membrane protein